MDILERMGYFERYGILCEDMLVYDIAKRKTLVTQMSVGLREYIGEEESYIILFADSANEEKIYAHDLQLVLHQDNIFIMRSEKYFIIKYSSVAAYVKALVDLKNSRDSYEFEAGEECDK